MQFQVPQFVEIEDKIFWRLTLKQFIYLAGGAGLSVAIYLTTPFFIALILIAPVAAISLALAFYTHNNRPFIFLLESAAKYLYNARLYIWRKEDKPIKATEIDKDKESKAGFVPRLSDSRLKELTWSLDAKQTISKK